MSVPKWLRDRPEFEQGRREADATVANNSLCLRVHGKINWQVWETVATLLNERFGIHVSRDDHCIVAEETVARDEGFNERMSEEFILRFGRDVVADVIREVERKRKKS